MVRKMENVSVMLSWRCRQSAGIHIQYRLSGYYIAGQQFKLVRSSLCCANNATCQRPISERFMLLLTLGPEIRVADYLLGERQCQMSTAFTFGNGFRLLVGKIVLYPVRESAERSVEVPLRSVVVMHISLVFTVPIRAAYGINQTGMKTRVPSAKHQSRAGRKSCKGSSNESEIQRFIQLHSSRYRVAFRATAYRADGCVQQLVENVLQVVQ